MAQAILSWNPVAGATGYLIEYKEASTSIWITPSSPANPTLLTTYPLTVTAGVLYNVRISTNCASGHITYRYIDVQAPNPVTYIWVPDNYTCEQDEVFTLDLTVSGLSSPEAMLYYQPTDRFYVIDADDPSGNFWWFDPDTFNAPGGRNYVAGQPSFSPSWIKTPAIDKARNRLLGAGDSTNGMVVYDIAANTFTTVSYGSNTINGFSRPSISLIGANYYCADLSGTPSIYIVSATSLTVINTVTVASIPSNVDFFQTSYGLTLVDGNIWCTCNTRTSTADAGNIGVYNSTLDTLIDTIVIPGAITWPGGSGRYWQSHFHDEVNNKWYVHDIGSNSFHVIDTISRTVVYSFTFDNREGKSNCNVGFVLNSITGELYGSYFGLNTINDGAQILRFYKINRTTYAFENMSVGTSVASLQNRTGTTEFWSVTPALFEWNVPNTGWDTDGQAFKYTL